MLFGFCSAGAVAGCAVSGMACSAMPNATIRAAMSCNAVGLIGTRTTNGLGVDRLVAGMNELTMVAVEFNYNSIAEPWNFHQPESLTPANRRLQRRHGMVVAFCSR